MSSLSRDFGKLIGLIIPDLFGLNILFPIELSFGGKMEALVLALWTGGFGNHPLPISLFYTPIEAFGALDDTPFLNTFKTLCNKMKIYQNASVSFILFDETLIDHIWLIYNLKPLWVVYSHFY